MWPHSVRAGAGQASEPASKPPPEPLAKMSLLAHLEELRKRLIASAVILAVGFAACWYFAARIFAFLEAPMRKFLPPGDKLAFTALADPFLLYMKVAFLAAIFFSSPLLLHQLWLFIAPGLYRRERLMAAPFIVATSVFFVAGGAFGYFVALPMICEFFLKTGEGFKQMVTVGSYLSLMSKVLLGMGLVFETPILIFFLARLGIVTPAFLMHYFRHAVLVIFLIAAIVTPTPDIVTQTTMAVPMVALYLLGVGVAWLFGKKH